MKWTHSCYQDCFQTYAPGYPKSKLYCVTFLFFIFVQLSLPILLLAAANIFPSFNFRFFNFADWMLRRFGLHRSPKYTYLFCMHKIFVQWRYQGAGTCSGNDRHVIWKPNILNSFVFFCFHFSSRQFRQIGSLYVSHARHVHHLTLISYRSWRSHPSLILGRKSRV